MRQDYLGLCLVIFLAYCNTTVFYNFYVYLRDIGIDPDWRGFLIGVSSLATIACFVALSHRLTRENAARFATLGSALFIGCGASYLVARDPYAILAVRLAHGAAVYLVTASCMTLLVAVIPAGRSGQAFSLYTVSYLVPYSVVPAAFDAFSGVIPNPAYGYAAMSLGLFGAIWAIRVVDRAAGGAVSPAGAGEKLGFLEMCANAARRPVAVLLGVNTLYLITFSSLFYMVKGLFEDRGYVGVGLFFTIQTASMIGVRLFGNRLFDRIGNLVLIKASFVLAAAGFVLAALVQGASGMYLAALLIGLGMGVGTPPMYALMLRVSGERFAAVNANLLMMSLQVGNFLGPVLGAHFVHELGYSGFLAINAGVSALGLGLCFLIPKASPDGR